MLYRADNRLPFFFLLERFPGLLGIPQHKLIVDNFLNRILEVVCILLIPTHDGGANPSPLLLLCIKSGVLPPFEIHTLLHVKVAVVRPVKVLQTTLHFLVGYHFVVV